VLERLNPILEKDPHLLLSEKGATEPEPMGSGFQLLATMTPVRSSADGNELSPAMANRFSIINMTDIAASDAEV